MLHRPRLVVLIALGLSLTFMLPGSVAAAAPDLAARVVQGGLEIPWDIGFTPGGKMVVTEREGRVRVFASGQAGARLLATTHISNVHADGEAGVMGIAIDHDFASTRWVFLCVSRNDEGQWRNQVIRYRMNLGHKLEFGKFLIRRGMRANTIHNGCALEEGPDGKLWISMGDANDAMDAQDPGRLNGKILRINRDGSIPDDNPVWPGEGGPTAVYSIGHRNPQGIAFHPENGRVYAVEHGPERDDEINWIRPGRNYGWPCVTGYNHPYMSCGGSATFTRPAWSSEGPTKATSGGVFVNGASWQDWNDDLMVATLKHSDLRRFAIDADGSPARLRSILFDERWGRLRAAVLGPNNKLYITTSNGAHDRVIRITPT